MNNRVEQLAAAKRRLEQYKAVQNRKETIHVEQDTGNESIMENQSVEPVVVATAAKEIEPDVTHAGNGTVTLTIDESEASSVVASASANHPDVTVPLPEVPTSIEFSAENVEDDPSKHGLNQSSEEDDGESNSNTNTSPVITPNARSERAEDVRHWVESDNLTKSLHQDIQPDTPTRASEHFGFYNQGTSPYTSFQPPSSVGQTNIQNGLPGTDMYELELTQLRQDNTHLQKRERELVAQLQDVERVIQTLTQEKENLKQEIRTDYLPLKQKFTKFSDENTELKVIISDLRVQLDTTLEENVAQKRAFEEMQSAFIKISNLIRDLESNWDIEQERLKMLEVDLREKSLRLDDLVHENEKLVQKEKMFDSVLHSRDVEIKTLQNQTIKLEKRIGDLLAGKTLDREDQTVEIGEDLTDQEQLQP